MLHFIMSFYHKFQYRKTLNQVKSSVSQIGTGLEISHGTRVRLIEGSDKKDIVLGSDVGFFSGCLIVSSNHGKIIIGDHVRFQRNIRIYCVEKVVIGDYTAVSTNVCITDNNNHPINPEFRQYMRTTPHGSNARSWIHSAHQPIIIGKNCWIGENCRIQKGVTIGDNSIIAACSVVTKDVPANCIAAGNPAKIVKTDINQIQAPTSCKEFNDYMASKK